MSIQPLSAPVDPPRLPVVNADQDNTRLLRQGVWLYFLLLIFEGAFRKWFLPGLANVFLLIRDPIALAMLAVAWKRGLFIANAYLAGSLAIGFVSICTAIVAGHGSIPVALYGARIFLIQFPLIFVIGRVFTRDDVLRMGQATLWIAIPMTVLITMQFYSPQTAWVNHGTGDSAEGAGFGGALGYFRPPGTFSFISGTTQFYGLVTSFVFYFWFNARQINRWILIGATLGLLAAIPFSISRTLFYQVCVAVAFVMIGVSRKPQHLQQLLIAVVGVVLVGVILASLPFFQTAIEAFTARFTGATEYEGGVKGTLIDRYLGGAIKPIMEASDMPLFGYGVGIGTNVGGMLLSGERTMLIYSEDEWARVIGELGPILGILAIGIRVSFCLNAAKAAYHRLVADDLLPWMLLVFLLLMVPQGPWGQSTTLGFGILIAGLFLASLHRKEELARP